MKVYLKDGNIYWLDEPLEGAEAEWELSPTQEDLLRNDGTAELVDGRLVIKPHVVEVIAVSNNVITKREFIGRVSPEEYAAIKTAAETNYIVDYFWQKFLVSEDIDLHHTDTIAGINMMEQAGLLAAGRAMEILS